MAKMKQKTDFCDIRKRRAIRAGLFGFTLKTRIVSPNEQYASKKKTKKALMCEDFFVILPIQTELTRYSLKK